MAWEKADADFPHPCVTNLKLHDENETSILMQDAFMCYLKHWIN